MKCSVKIALKVLFKTKCSVKSAFKVLLRRNALSKMLVKCFYDEMLS